MADGSVGRRVVITGIGAITPIGLGREGLWAGVRRGRSAVRRVTRFDPSPFPSQIAAEIDGFDPLDFMDAKKARRLDRFSQLAIATSRQALDGAGLVPSGEDADTCAVYIGSALGGVAFGEEQHARYLQHGFRAVDTLLALAVFGGAGATNVAMEFGLRGAVVGNANSCASGLFAVGEVFRLIRAGAGQIGVAGGVEAPMAPLTFGAFARIRAMSTRNDEPERASRPFDRGRDGFVMAEGAATFVLEELEHALARGARPLAEILGYGTTNDAYHMTTPLPTGREAARAISLALEDGRVSPGEIDYVSAHATSTPLGDIAETVAIRTALGEHGARVPVSGTKGLHGHSLGATGAIELAITALALEHGWAPPSANLDDPDPECLINHIGPCGHAAAMRTAVTNSFGFGGINASMVIRRWG